MNKWIVITTINGKTDAIKKFDGCFDWNMVVVGDKKSRPIASTDRLVYLSVEDQLNLGYAFARHCPYNHYARKNIGYLFAMAHGADVIYDTDDDNYPYDHWGLRDFECGKYLSSGKYVNVYKHFTDEHIWPRGLPLDEIMGCNELVVEDRDSHEIGVWQGLADLDPDVDAIYRLAVNKEIKFNRKDPVSLDAGSYCPFNSQNTFWNSKAFPLLYLPSTTSFRFTDILRGYIAQPLMWENSLYLGFSDASVYQERNQHDLMKDFRDEIECYLNVKDIVRVLENICIEGDLTDVLDVVYRELAGKGYVKQEEISLLGSWLSDIKAIQGGSCG